MRSTIYISVATLGEEETKIFGMGICTFFHFIPKNPHNICMIKHYRYSILVNPRIDHIYIFSGGIYFFRMGDLFFQDGDLCFFLFIPKNPHNICMILLLLLLKLKLPKLVLEILRNNFVFKSSSLWNYFIANIFEKNVPGKYGIVVRGSVINSGFLCNCHFHKK